MGEPGGPAALRLLGLVADGHREYVAPQAAL